MIYYVELTRTKTAKKFGSKFVKEAFFYYYYS